MYRHLRALQPKWRNLPSLCASSVVLLTYRVGGMLIRLSCVRVVHVFPGASTLPAFCHRPSTRVRCWLPREIPRQTAKQACINPSLAARKSLRA